MVPDFCTYFDSGYLPRAIALYESLCIHVPGARLFCVCMDEESLRLLTELNLPGMIPISRRDFERDNDELASLATTRSAVEYYFSCTASVVLYVLNTNSDIGLLFYVDADFWFLNSIRTMLDDMGEGSVYIVEHRFPDSQKHLEVYGRFNVGILGFRNDLSARQCLAQWRQDCLEWCFDRLEGDRFADQKYLDRWPATCRDLVIAKHPGVNVAPWNKANCEFQMGAAGVLVDGIPLICFHFQGFRLYRFGFVEPQVFDYGSDLSKECLELIYYPYLRALNRIGAMLGQRAGARRYNREPDLRTLWRTRHKSPYLLLVAGYVFPLKQWNVLLAMLWLRVAQGAMAWRRSISAASPVL